MIVELCEDIRIDTIQLANFEFFSGIFKDFRVSVAHAYTSDGNGWVIVGDYTAKNVRGVQVRIHLSTRPCADFPSVVSSYQGAPPILSLHSRRLFELLWH